MEVNQVETINLTELISNYQISDENFFNRYIRETWSALISKNKKKIKGIEKIIFNKYYELPGIFSERVFSVLDKDNDGILGEEEFTKGMLKLFSKGTSLKSLVKLIFKIYDLDKDGKISKEDVRFILSYIPIYNNDNQENYQYYLESQNQIKNLIKIIFKEKNEIDVNIFYEIIKNINSDIFVPILLILLEKKPFSNESIRLYISNNNSNEEIILNDNSQLETEIIVSPSFDNLLLYLNIKKKISYLKLKFDSKFSLLSVNEKKEDDNNTQANSLLDSFSDLNTTYDESTKTIEEDLEEKNIYYEGYIFKLVKEKIKKIYFKLINKDLYYYKNKEDKKHRGLINLSGVFVKEDIDKIINSKKYYTLTTICEGKNIYYYFEDIKNRNIWLDKIKLGIKQRNINDYYEIYNIIGKGKYGLVKYGINIKTKQQVAIKIISKKNMNITDLEMAITEINILKICHHPYIIKLYDVFETNDEIYIIMEYFENNLLSYIKKYNYILSEKKACEIIYKLSLAINYIHSFGIIHRDLKPENILITDYSSNIDIRLLDFGLSKIILPNEKLTESYGTIGYAAPELLLKKPYNKSVDIWSLGIISFFLLCGYLPFDDKESKEEIARKTIKEPIPFEENIWKNKSNEAKDFINKLLEKDPEKRLNINQILDHSWFKNLKNGSCNID